MKKLIFIGLMVLFCLSPSSFWSTFAQENLVQLVSLEIIPEKRPSTNIRLPLKRPEQPLLSLILSNNDYEYFDLALKSVKKWEWKRVEITKHKIQNKNAKKILDWIRYYNGADDLTFTDYKEFIKINSHWPLIKNVKLKAEGKISFQNNHNLLIKYFKNQKPQTGWGNIYYGNALLDKDRERAIQLIKKGYIYGSLSRREQKTVITKFKSILDKEDHKKRINELLWDGKYRTAKSLIKYVDKDYQKLFEARIALISYAGGVDHLISEVPDKLKKDPGLQHDRLKWRIKKRKYESSLSLIYEINKNPSSYFQRPEKLWKLKSFLIWLLAVLSQNTLIRCIMPMP